MSALHLGGGKAKHVAVIDVGSASAAVGIVRVEKNGHSMVLAAQRSFIPYEKRTPEQFAARMSSTVVEAAQKAMQIYAVRKDKVSSIGEAHVFFRAPWTEAEVLKFTTTFPESTKITNSHLEEISQKAIENKGKVLEAIVLRTEVNGYQTQNPVGKAGTMLSIFTLASSVNESLQNTTADAIQQAFPQAKLRWRSHMRALLTVVREQQSRSKNTVIVDISSEGASFLSIRNGILDNQISCDIGVHEILERLAKGSLPEETLGMIRMLERNQCSGAACDALKASMEKLETELVREYGEKISQLASHGRLATDLLLFAHPDISPWFARFFAKLDFSQFTIPLQPFTVTELTAKDLQNWIQTESGGADTSFLLSCALVHIESQPER